MRSNTFTMPLFLEFFMKNLLKYLAIDNYNLLGYLYIILQKQLLTNVLLVASPALNLFVFDFMMLLM